MSLHQATHLFIHVHLNMSEFNFKIESSGSSSVAFRSLGILDFKSAAAYIQCLPYKRNKEKKVLNCVLIEGLGTCSTKHALLKQLADENNFTGLKLIVGIFKMNAINTPVIAPLLKQNDLQYIPEAHCY